MTLDGPGNVDVLQIIAELQKVVVCLKEKDRLSRVVASAKTLRESMQKRNTDNAITLNKISNITIDHSPPEGEERCNQNRQLRDLDSENRQLRDMYEDAQWTLHLIMEQHRTNVKRLCDDNRSQTVTPNEIPLEKETLDDHRAFLYEHFIGLAMGFNEIMRKEAERSGNNLEKVDLLLKENLVLRELLNGDCRNIDTRTLLEKVEKKVPLDKFFINCSSMNSDVKVDCVMDNSRIMSVETPSLPINSKANVVEN